MQASHTITSLPAPRADVTSPANGVPVDISGSSITQVFPDVSMDCPNPSEHLLTRRGVLEAKRGFAVRREDTGRELRGMKPSPEKDTLYQELRFCADEEQELERRLQEYFVPQHGLTQFLSPRAFFQSCLFNARGRAVERRPNVEIDLPTGADMPAIRYSGPELRQSDAKVFLALLHMLRDVQVGTRVIFQVEAMCIAVFGRYDGNSRRQLLTHIQRLQKGLIVTAKFSVQLCQEFAYPRRGPWGVALHPRIVELFRISPRVWLSIPVRMTLKEGLSTWLYAYVESQSRLIPMRIAKLHELSGSEAEERAFGNSLRDALRELSRWGIIDPGWTLLQGQLRWMKKRPAPPET